MPLLPPEPLILDWSTTPQEQAIASLLRAHKLPHGNVKIAGDTLTAGFQKALKLERDGSLTIDDEIVVKPTLEGRVRIVLGWELSDKELMRALNITIQDIQEQELIPRGTIHRYINNEPVEEFWEPRLFEYFRQLRTLI